MGYIGKCLEAGPTLKEWKTGKFWANVGVNILLVAIICISAVLCVSSFYFNDLFNGFEQPARAGMVMFAALGMSLYAEFTYKVIFDKWACDVGVGTLFMICMFGLFTALGLITFVVFLLFCLQQWWTSGLFSISFFPVLWSGVLFFAYFVCRIFDA